MIPFVTTFLAWVFQSFTGFGAGIFIVGVLSLVYDPKEVIVSSALANITGTVLVLIQNRRGSCSCKTLGMLILPSIPGIYVGSYMLSRVDRHLLKLIIGTFIVLLGLYDYLLQKGKLSFKLSSRFGPLAGLLGGLSAGFVGLGGPPPAVYLNQKTDTVESFKLMLNLYFTSNILFRLIFYYHQDVFYLNTELLLYSAVGVPLGVFIGGVLSRKFATRNFRSVVALSVLFLGFFVMIF